MAAEQQSHDAKFSQEIQHKYELYLIGLVFTLLGLSIQTAEFGVIIAADIYEILGWASLLASGLFGLWRLEWVPVALTLHADSVNLQYQKKTLEQHQAAGVSTVLVGERQESISSVINERAIAIMKLETRIKEIERSVLARYAWHRRLFVVGVVDIIISRAYVPVYEILCAIT